MTTTVLQEGHQVQFDSFPFTATQNDLPMRQQRVYRCVRRYTATMTLTSRKAAHDQRHTGPAACHAGVLGP
jgi:hypothetical protein